MTDNRSSVMEVLDRVRRRELTPREAEQLFADQGQDSPIATAPPGGLPPVVWPLSLAFTWIAWRSDAVLGREWERFKFWGVTLEDETVAEGQLLTIAEARRELGRALLAGEVVANGIESGHSARTSIKTVEWPDLKFEPDGSSNVVTAGWLQPRWHDVRVTKAEVKKLWPSHAALVAGQASSDPAMLIGQPSPKRGRKPDPEVDRFWIEIVKATSTGQHGSQRALIEYMVLWAAQNDCKYDAETIRKKVGSLYREMGWRDGTAG